MMRDPHAGTRWQREPHVRVGDPCYLCGTPMVPASRTWPAAVIPPGHRIHGSYGLCRRCYQQRHTSPEVAALVRQAKAVSDAG